MAIKEHAASLKNLVLTSNPMSTADGTEQAAVSSSPETTSETHKRQFIPHAKFSAIDDEQLRAAVELHDSKDWGQIAELIPGKNERQCRERWFNYLCPSLSTKSWTAEADELLLAKHSQLGNKWVKIARSFPNRTDAMVKNRFAQLQRRESKQQRMQAKGNPTVMGARPAPRPLFPASEDPLWNVAWDTPFRFRCHDDNLFDEL
jgi:hypothetical protein